ncbi:unnamed protein product [Paramecium sonneborni]|uniref:RNA helicase n=1 Tax=Paramecium sonneborni TaxID=65129 RepID=A0A8S1QGT4_9CILI|nr:unnamed protein product [Paramecium sonneborni]
MFASCPGEFEEFKKCFIDASDLQYRQEDIEKFRSENNITIIRNGEQDNNIIQPFLDWKHFPLGAPEFEQPTAIQSEVIPIILSGRNTQAIAQTGSGKTLAYLLPALVHLEQHVMKKESPQPKLLILVPTRELGVQIYDQLLQLIEYYYGNKKQNEKENAPNLQNLKLVCIYGGNPNKKQQVELIQKGVHVIVATPGRMVELIEEGMVNLNKITMLILDEADRMLDMGFEPQVRDIVSTIREDRQTILLSATWPNEVQQLSMEFCNNPILVKIGKGAPITQKIICTGQKEKLHVLMNVLDDLIYTDKVLIFAETKKRCEDLSQSLTKQGYFCISLHGDKSQDQRDAIMKQFKDSNTRLICATDIASRGLDVKDITVVVNYDFPKSFDDYIHRIGRTGRAGAHGRSFSLLSYEKDEGILADQIITYLNSCNQEVNAELLEFKDKASKIKQERQQRKLQQYIDNSNQSNIPNSIYPPNNFGQTSEIKEDSFNKWEAKQFNPNYQKKPYHKHSRSEYNEDHKNEQLQSYQQQQSRNYNMDFKNKQLQDRQLQDRQSLIQTQQQQFQSKKNINDSRQVNLRNQFSDADIIKPTEAIQELDLKNYKLLPQFQEDNKTNSFNTKWNNEQNSNQKIFNMDFRNDTDHQNKKNNESQFYNDKYLNHIKPDRPYNNDKNHNNNQRNYDKNFNNNHDRPNNNFDRNHNERNNFDRSNNERNFVDKNNNNNNNERNNFDRSNNERNFVDKNVNNNNERNNFDRSNFIDKNNNNERNNFDRTQNERKFIDKNNNNERNTFDRANNERNFIDKNNNSERNNFDRSNNERNYIDKNNERNNNERFNNERNNNERQNERNNNERYNDRNNNERYNERNFNANNYDKNERNFNNNNNFDRTNNERNFNNNSSYPARNFTGGNDKNFNERPSYINNDKYSNNNKQINSIQNDRQFNTEKIQYNDQNFENDDKNQSKQYKELSKSDFTKYQNMKGQQK